MNFCFNVNFITTINVFFQIIKHSQKMFLYSFLTSLIILTLIFVIEFVFFFWWRTKSFKCNKCHYVENQNSHWHISISFESILYSKNNAFLFFLLNCFFDYLQFFIHWIWLFCKNLILMLFFLRYFEMLLKIFVFFDLIIILIFIFLNFVHKRNKSNAIRVAASERKSVRSPSVSRRRKQF